MIDIVLCHSILEKCGYVDAFSSDPETVQMILRLRQHRIVISEKLMEYYEEYFQNKSPELLEWYRNYCTDMFYTQERTDIMKLSGDKVYIKEDMYLNELTGLASKTKDKVLLIEPKDRINNFYRNKWKLSVLDSTDMKDDRGGNTFSMYTLPVNGKMIDEGDDSNSLAEWFGRFLDKEDYIQIFDNYLLTKVGIEYLKKYILKYIKAGTDIEIYSMEDPELPEQAVRDEFQKKYYQKWNFTVFFITSKKNQHARSIQGSKYIIQVERGVSVFGRAERTFQSIVNIYANKDRSRIILKESHLKQVI